MTTSATALAVSRIKHRDLTHVARGGYTFCDVEVGKDIVIVSNGTYPSCKKCRREWKTDRDARSRQRVVGSAPTVVAPPPSLDTLCNVAQGQIDAMSWTELDAFVDMGITCIALNQASITAARQAMAPAIALIHDKLTRPGQRTDLMEHPPITWKMWCENKRRLGCKRTLDELVKIAKFGSSEKLLVGDTVIENGTGEKGKVVLIDEATDKVSVRFDGEQEDQTVSPADISKASVKTTKLPQVGEIIREGDRRFDVVYIKTIEEAISQGDTIGRANPIQRAHGMITGDIIVSFAVRDVTWKTWTPKFAVRFDERLVKYDFGELDEISLAYAITIHKSQGSEFPAVVIPLATQHYMLLQRNLIYTGITRGKRLLVLIGQKKALGIAVRNDRPQRRYSGLLASLKGNRGTEGSAVEPKTASQSRAVS